MRLSWRPRLFQHQDRPRFSYRGPASNKGAVAPARLISSARTSKPLNWSAQRQTPRSGERGAGDAHEGLEANMNGIILAVEPVPGKAACHAEVPPLRLARAAKSE